MVGNASFLANFLHWLAIAFRWFLRLILVLLAAGVVLGIGALIYGSLPARSARRGGKLESCTDRDGLPDADPVELDLLATDCDPDHDQFSDSGEEY